MTLADAGCSVPQVGIWRQRGVVAVVGSQTDAGERSRARQCVGAVPTANCENATDELSRQHRRGAAVLHGRPRGWMP